MKILGIIDADFERSPLGTRARLAQPLAGQAVLRRTAQRVLEARRLTSVHCVVPGAQAGTARDVLAGLPVQIETQDAGPPPWQRFVASCRKWALDSCLGGLGGTTVFDESLHPWVAEGLTQREGAQAAAIVPAAAALLDPVLLDAMLEHYEKVHEEVRLTYTQSAPGLTACICGLPLLADLARAGQYIGRTMAYRPADPQREMNVQPCFYQVGGAIACAGGRCLADTSSGFDTVSRIIAELGERADAGAISRWLLQQHLYVPHLPDEVEVELTTQDPLAETTLRPRGACVPAREPMSEAIFARLVEALGGRDDVRLVLGGFGDPLMHPDWPRLLQIARQAGIFGLVIRTPAVHLDARSIEQIVAARVDIVNVLLDAHTPETYLAVHGADHFQRVQAAVESLLQAARRPEHGGVPIVACEMIKTRRTMPEMEAFYDHWLRKGCGAVIVGPSRYGGQRPDLAVMDMSPPTRAACRRLMRRCLVLSDGTVSLCDQDFTGGQVMGRLAEQGLAEIWTGERLAQTRLSHRAARWSNLPLCSACSEWHRP